MNEKIAVVTDSTTYLPDEVKEATTNQCRATFCNN